MTRNNSRGITKSYKHPVTRVKVSVKFIQSGIQIFTVCSADIFNQKSYIRIFKYVNLYFGFTQIEKTYRQQLNENGKLVMYEINYMSLYFSITEHKCGRLRWMPSAGGVHQNN